VAIDVGANHGAHTVLFGALVGREGRVISFEPNPAIAARLRLSVDRNDWRHVEIRELALSDAKDERELRLSPGAATMSSFAERLRPGETDVVPVRTGTLDAELNGVPHVRLLKIDVEGWELPVLRGGEQVFARHPPDYVVIEIVFEQDEHAHPMLARWGYELVETAQPDAFYRYNR
jgi:FkbM family methyltransferase